MRGRRPDASAHRSGPPAPAAEYEVSVVRLPKPHDIEENPLMSDCWDLVVGDGSQYQIEDVPQLRQLCYWYAVHEQCMANTIAPDGRIRTKIVRRDEKGNVVNVKTDPDILTARMAADKYRALAAELGVSPLARQRMGLMDSLTKSTQADVVRKTEEVYERMKREIAESQSKGLPDAQD